MTTINRRNFNKAIFSAAVLASGSWAKSAFAQEKTAICYNVPAEWAGWGNMLELIAKETGIHVPIDNKNSGQAVSQVIAGSKKSCGRRNVLGDFFCY